MRRSKVLIVDDNRDLADGLADIIDSEGHSVTVTYTGEDAIQLARDIVFDVIFLDMKLPDLTGIEVFRRIHGECPDTRIIIITGYRIEQLMAMTLDSTEMDIIRAEDFDNKIRMSLQNIKQNGVVFIADKVSHCEDRLSMYVSDSGRKFAMVNNYNDALKVISSNNADDLVIGMKVSIICAIAICLELRIRGKQSPVIIIANHDAAVANGMDALRSIPATGCMFKPFSPIQVITVIEGYE